MTFCNYAVGDAQWSWNLGRWVETSTHGHEILKPPIRRASAVTLHQSKAQDPIQNTMAPSTCPQAVHKPIINQMQQEQIKGAYMKPVFNNRPQEGAVDDMGDNISENHLSPTLCIFNIQYRFARLPNQAHHLNNGMSVGKMYLYS